MSGLFPSITRVPGYLWRATRAVGRAARKFLLYVLPPLLVIHIAATLITGRLVGKEMKGLADAGHPLTLAEIAPAVPPEGENAADVYQQAFDSLRRSHEEEVAIFWADDPDGPEVMAVAREVVAANERYFDLLDRASRMPECVFPVDWEAGSGAVFPHWARMRDAARMLAVRAQVLNADGRSDEALADCATIFRLAEHAKAEPTLIAQLVAVGIELLWVKDVGAVIFGIIDSILIAVHGGWIEVDALNPAGIDRKPIMAERRIVGNHAARALVHLPVEHQTRLFSCQVRLHGESDLFTAADTIPDPDFVYTPVEGAAARCVTADEQIVAAVVPDAA